MDELKELKQSCSDSLEMLETLAFVKLKKVMSDGTPYYVVVAENSTWKIVYEAYKNMLNLIEALEQKTASS